MANPASPIPEGAEDNIVDYYDIMVIGKTGMGKSTTADKLIIANPDGHDYLGEQHEDEREIEDQVQMSDLSIWKVADADGEQQRVTERLKHLVMHRSLDKPHEAVNEMYSTAMRITIGSQVISNETTRVRVLDVPGFFGTDVGEMSAAQNTSDRVNKSGLRIMREILYIQSKMRMKFRRIVYFIPDRGPLERSHKVLLMELEHMMHYFGKSIFESMVLVTTQPLDIYQYVPKGVTPFSDEAVAKTRESFSEALAQVMPEDERLPVDQPPIVFVSIRDTCEDILEKVKEARVIRRELRLKFDHRTCVRCGLKAKILMYKDNRKRKVACFSGQDPSVSMPYAESHCHPLIISKYWTITKIVGGIAHFVTRKKYHGRWPDFRNPDDQVCIACGKLPGEQGCRKVATRYMLHGQAIFVDHSPTQPFTVEDQDEVQMEIPMEEHRQIEQLLDEPLDEPADPVYDNAAVEVQADAVHEQLPERDPSEQTNADLRPDQEEQTQQQVAINID